MEKTKIDKIIEAFRHSIQLKEEGMIANSLGTSPNGQMAGTFEAGDDPPVDLRKGKQRNWNPFFKNLAKVQRRKPQK